PRFGQETNRSSLISLVNWYTEHRAGDRYSGKAIARPSSEKPKRLAARIGAIEAADAADDARDVRAVRALSSERRFGRPARSAGFLGRKAAANLSGRARPPAGTARACGPDRRL